MRRLALGFGVLLLVLATSTAALAADGKARVRVVHASPDAPAVDVWVNGNVAFSNAPFKGITNYAALDPGTYNVQVVPTGATEPVVIDADLDLAGDTDYTVVAMGQLEDIEPVVLVDDNTLPAAGQAHVRFVHASPDAPNVDIAVQDGPVLFENVPFKQAFPYVPVDAGTYDLEVRVHDTGDVVLNLPGVALADGTVYTVYAVGLAGGAPALQAVTSVDATASSTLPATGGTSSVALASLMLLGMGLMFLLGGWFLKRAPESA